jgi:spore germination protein KC
MLILMLLLLSGCSDLVEVDENVYPLVIGVDLGVNNKVRLTIQYPSYKGGSQGSMGGGKKGGESKGGSEVGETGELDNTVITTIEAATILEGMNLLNTGVARTISLTHAKMFVISEQYARNGIGEYLSPMIRYRETRRIMYVVVCREKAEDFIKTNKSTIGVSATKSIESMIKQSENSGQFTSETFVDFYKSMISPYKAAVAGYAGVNEFNNLTEENKGQNPPLDVKHDFLPGELPRKGAAKREFYGTAVFKGDKMVGYLSARQTRYLMMINGELKRAIVSFEDKNKPGNAIVVDERLGRKPKITASFENGNPVINVKLNIEGDLGAIQSRINYEYLNRIDELNNYLEESIKEGVKETIEKCQKEFGSDIFGFGYKFAGYFDTIQEFQEYNWFKHFPEAKVNVDVDFNVRRTGLMYGSAPLISNED